MCQNENDPNERKKIQNDAFYIPVPKSRNIYGVCDISGKLKKGECFVQVTVHKDENQSVQEKTYRRVRQAIGLKMTDK
jgi:hypothetical protein